MGSPPLLVFLFPFGRNGIKGFSHGAFLRYPDSGPRPVPAEEDLRWNKKKIRDYRGTFFTPVSF
jgi:hypothetical protein